MPDWRYNVLSTSEAFVEALHQDRVHNAAAGDPLAASYPRRADRTRVPHTCPYTTIFLGSRSHNIPYRLPVHDETTDIYADAYSVDRSSNLTDTSSFARYEDRRLQLEECTEGDDDEINNHVIENDGSVTLQIQKVPYTSSVFYVSAKSEQLKQDISPAEVYMVEGTSDSDALSSCTCDSFERCEFDCKDFEPFSDTCCCDPLENGVCSRSPKDVDSPEHFCERTLDEDGVSARSDMEGLDLALFEPANVDLPEEQCEDKAQVAATLCGVMYALPDISSGESSSYIN